MTFSWSIRKAMPWIILAIAVTAVLGLWSAERRAREARHRLALEMSAEQLGLRFEDFVQHRLNALRILVDRIDDMPVFDRENYGYSALKIIDNFPGFQAINWIDEEHVIRWVNPVDGNQEALGKDLDDNEIAAPAILRAAETGDFVVTAPLLLYQGGRGFAVYAPASRGAMPAGFVNGVFRLADLVTATLENRQDSRLGYRLLHGESLVYGHETTADLSWSRSVTYPLHGPLEGWAVELAEPQPEAFSQYLLLFAGLLLALGMAGLVDLAMRREDTVMSQEARFRQLVSAAREGVWVADENGRATFVNRRICDLLGRTSEELIGSRIDEVLDESAEFPSADLLQSERPRADEHVGERDFLHRRPDGSEVWLRVAVSPVHDESRALKGDLILVSDISQRRRLEAQLLQTRKMEALGRLAGGVAHDFNNMLTAILAGCDLAKLDIPEDSEARGHLDEVSDSARRAARLTARLLTFSRQRSVEPQAVDLRELVADMQNITLRAVERQGLEIRFELGEEEVPVRVDRSQFDQLLLNLVVNASDAMPDGGCIQVRIGRLAPARSTRMGSRIVPAGEYGVLDVLDEGRGIPDAIADLVFEPFFTTKEPGTGTGLGLATVHGVVAQAGGLIVVENRVGGGTLFRVLLPIAS